MRVIVTGSRRLRGVDGFLILKDLRRVSAEHPGERLTVIHGGAGGADVLAGIAASMMGVNVWAFPAEWHIFGKAAGSVRNQEMLETGKPDLVLAYPDRQSTGTWDMVRRAHRAGVAVVIDRSFMDPDVAYSPDARPSLL